MRKGGRERCCVRYTVRKSQVEQRKSGSQFKVKAMGNSIGAGVNWQLWEKG